MYHYDTRGSSAWTKVSSTNDASAKTVSSAIDGFSGYAVSW